MLITFWQRKCYNETFDGSIFLYQILILFDYSIKKGADEVFAAHSSGSIFR